ncbi:UbiX family flavin prenyltransferase [Halapricum desulfuricans]|uniref:UbiX family flavin prenyltransferase n=1 Tax=Halapricum desulfuricans TaxID=2841257 RepID=UPI001E511E0E|nr:UbiX family flavin prenyltransferase [Halapricum desulfuricans]
MSTVDRVVVGITGASGIPIAVRTVEALSEHGEVVTVVTDAAKSVMAHERGDREATMKHLEELSAAVYGEDAVHAPVASGSVRTDGMVIVPASMNTVAAVATGRSDTLVSRAADVTLKERRRLVVVPRETPLSELHLENLLKLARMGVEVVPPVLGFYFDPEDPADFVDHVVGKILERFDLEHDRYDAWEPE